MSLSPAFLDELRARVPVSGVVGRRVKLTRAGREMKGCCPFHNEKTPSFYVNDDKGFYHCFGCGAHGDVIRFLTDNMGLPFMEAVKQLASEAGLEVPAPSPDARAKAEVADSLADLTSKAAQWFQAQLAGEAGAAARAYLDRRGVKDATRKQFGLGFSLDSRTALRGHLKEATAEKLLEAGLIGKSEDGETFDRFRGRLMFPIRDRRGRVVGFGGRALGDVQPKYLNSADGPLFDKGRLLYNLDLAGPAARKVNRLIVVEGYMDVIGLAQAGIAEAVAPLGTAMTETQLALAWRLVDEPILCFDGDAAGLRAATRAGSRALPLLKPGKSLRIATL
ncbi:DNA primase, partial [Sandarakinorhabdus rubra]|uniref:DNA primase n=1 Tax=Sandarakinorhabdus rubra TaxID=2672568 RepID=UPI0013DAA404